MGKWVKAKDLMVGEMFTTDFDEHMMHTYHEVVGHNHENKVVLAKWADDRWYQFINRPQDPHKIPYDNPVLVRPESPMCAHEDFRKKHPPYKQWPYDAEGNFSFTPLDWSNGPPA
jgi:hypothetical protein